MWWSLVFYLQWLFYVCVRCCILLLLSFMSLIMPAPRLHTHWRLAVLLLVT